MRHVEFVIPEGNTASKSLNGGHPDTGSKKGWTLRIAGYLTVPCRLLQPEKCLFVFSQTEVSEYQRGSGNVPVRLRRFNSKQAKRVRAVSSLGVSVDQKADDRRAPVGSEPLFPAPLPLPGMMMGSAQSRESNQQMRRLCQPSTLRASLLRRYNGAIKQHPG